MYFLTTNNLGKVNSGIINRCHLIEMNQVTTPSAYVSLGQIVLQNMGVVAGLVPISTLQEYAARSRGSMRSFMTDVTMAGLSAGGAMP